MRVLVQRVTSASVSVDGRVVGAIDPVGQGLVALVGVTHTDDAAVAERMAEKVWQLRVLDDERSAADAQAHERRAPGLDLPELVGLQRAQLAGRRRHAERRVIDRVRRADEAVAAAREAGRKQRTRSGARRDVQGRHISRPERHAGNHARRRRQGMADGGKTGARARADSPVHGTQARACLRIAE